MLLAIDKAKLAAVPGKVVKAAQYAEIIEARAAIAQALRYAAQIRAAADAEIEAARQRGYEEGTQAARADVAASMVETVARLQSAFIGLETRIVSTVTNAIRQIIGVLDERTLMDRLMRRVLAQARTEKRLRLRVAAAQFDMVNELLQPILAEFPDVELIDVLKDPDGAPGTCVLESDFGVIDACIETQLAAVQRGLVNALVNKRLTAAIASD